MNERTKLAFRIWVSALLSISLIAATGWAATPASAAVSDADSEVRWATVEPGANGLAVLTGGAGADPKVVARLSIGGMESRMWTGYGCLTGSGRYVAATFAPVEFADDPALRDGGAFLAIVDLDGDNGVRILDELVALKYHTPGCGPANEIAAVRHIAAEDGAYSTEVLAIDGATGSVNWRDSYDGKLSWPAPTGDSVLLAAGNEVVSAAVQGVETVATVEGQVVDLHAADDGVDFSVLGENESLEAVSLVDGTEVVVASGRVGEARWARGSDGENRIQVLQGVDVQETDRALSVEEISEAVSLDGRTVASVEYLGSESSAGAADASPDEIRIEQSSAESGGSAGATAIISDGADQVIDASRQLVFEAQVDGVCAIPRNDPSIQVVQPSPAQVEWAAHRAVRGELNIRRAANWQKNGLPAYYPQREFPLVELDGGGRIPAQVLLGALAQESNFWQAARGALPGVAANPLIGNYYGVLYHRSGPDRGKIRTFDLSRADCGYGVGQITDGMRKSDTGLPFRSANQQKMIATDYVANISEAQRILAEKWNQLYGTMIPAGTDPSLVENWYLPLWAYNCCFYSAPFSDTGMGWTNNPSNSDYRFDRLYFMRAGLDDAKRPGDWPYQERVMGFVEQGLWLYGSRAFTPIDGVLSGLPVVGDQINPYFQPVDRFAFCDASNSCSETYYDPDNLAGGANPVPGDRSFCTRSDRRCWWNQPLPFQPSSIVENPAPYVLAGGSEPTEVSPYPPACSPNDAAMPEYDVINSVSSRAVIVDDVPRQTSNVAGCRNVKTAGTFEFTHGAEVAQIDVHQIGSGYGGHFWYGHTVRESRPAHKVTGTWTPPSSTRGWRRILVHIPPTGADTYQADYQIFDGSEAAGDPASYHRVVNQRWNENRWVDLGVFQLSSGARVELSNVTYSDHGDPVNFGPGPAVDEYYTDNRSISIAWDAIAFVPAGRPKVAMVSFGDSYSSGEGNTGNNYYSNSDIYKNSSNTTNACHRTPDAYGPLAFSELDRQNSGTVTYSFLACSGATLLANIDGLETHWGEVPQLDTGWVDKNTTHITVGIGGNDVRFAEILTGCLFSITRACHLESVDFRGDQVTVDERLRIELAELMDVYRDFVLELKDRAKQDARIVLVGYPYVIGSGGVSTCIGFSDLEIEWLRTSTDRLNNEIRAMTDLIDDVEFAPIMNAYAGHEACTSDQFINDVDVEFACGACSDLEVLRAGSFHPNSKGHAAAAPAVVDALTRRAGSQTAPGVIGGGIWKRRETRPIGGDLPVELFRALADDSRGSAVASTRSAADGSYEFRNLAAGCYVVAFQAPPGDVFDSNGLTTLDVTACVQNGETRQVDGQLENGTGSASIAGRVRNGTTTIPGVDVEIYRSNEAGDQLALHQEMVTNDNPLGPNYKFEVADLDPPCWLLRFYAPAGLEFTDGAFEWDEHRCIGSLFDTTINVDLVESSTPTVSVQSTAITETNGRRTLRVRLTLDQAATVRSQVRYRTVEGTATVGDDFRTKAGTVTFTRGQRSKTISIVILGDRVAEPVESFQVALFSPSLIRLGTDGVIVINDND